MILFGCLLAFSAAVAPRLVLILAWIFSARWPVVWQGDFLMPLLGILLLPYTTIMYLLVWSPAVGGGGNIEGWDWMWIILGLFLDLMKWSQVFANRKEAAKQTQKYYPSGAPGNTSVAAASAATGSSTTSVEATPPPAPAPAAPEAPAADNPKLDELDQMKASGALTDEEYEAAKSKLAD